MQASGRSPQTAIKVKIERNAVTVNLRSYMHYTCTSTAWTIISHDMIPKCLAPGVVSQLTNQLG